jgi:hypothetical protein
MPDICRLANFHQHAANKKHLDFHSECARQVSKILWKFASLYTVLLKTGSPKDYKCGYRLGSKIKDKGFEADLYKKH